METEISPLEHQGGGRFALLRSPGIHLLLCYVWVVPFLLLSLGLLGTNGLPSYMPFVLVFGVTTIWAVALNVLDLLTKFYWRRSVPARVMIISGLYVLNTELVARLTIYGYSHRTVEFFDTDPEGSFAMFYLPTMALAFFLCASSFVILVLMWGIGRRLRNAPSSGR